MAAGVCATTPTWLRPFAKVRCRTLTCGRYWDTITCPTLVLRGADSDLLLRTTAEEMQTRGPRARLVEFSGIGHAPMLMADDQIAVVKEFLLAPE